MPDAASSISARIIPNGANCATPALAKITSILRFCFLTSSGICDRFNLDVCAGAQIRRSGERSRRVDAASHGSLGHLSLGPVDQCKGPRLYKMVRKNYRYTSVSSHSQRSRYQGLQKACPTGLVHQPAFPISDLDRGFLYQLEVTLYSLYHRVQAARKHLFSKVQREVLRCIPVRLFASGSMPALRASAEPVRRPGTRPR